MRHISHGKLNSYVFKSVGEQDHVRFWHLADLEMAAERVCFEAKQTSLIRPSMSFHVVGA
jgi:hypothetical protein